MPTLRSAGAATLLAMLLMSASPAGAAQDRIRQRAPGTIAFGGDLGLANPVGDDDFDAELLVDGWFEYFQTSRLGWRGMISLVDFDAPPAPPGLPDGDVELAIINANALWHFRNGRVSQPFVTGGVGLYDFDVPGDDDLEPGLEAGGGVDLFIAPSVALKFEALLHATSGDQEPDDLFTATGGVRFEF